MIEITVAVNVPSECSGGCQFCDEDYRMFQGWCILFQESLKLKGHRGGHRGGAQIFHECEQCLNHKNG